MQMIAKGWLTMNCKYDVVALGELLIDFTQNGYSEKCNPLFEANPGGAPCNVLAMLTKLSYHTAFIGKVGDDAFGRRLGQILCQIGIDDTCLQYDSTVPTTLAFVQQTASGDRSFTFYRSPGADTMLTVHETAVELIKQCRIFHFGSLSLTDEPAATATKVAVKRAQETEKMISFDPNLRPLLWKDLEQAKKAIWYGIENCDILKIADNEIEWLTGTGDYDQGVARIKERSHAKLICVTLGKAGSIAYSAQAKVFGAPFVNTNVIDATGAGDTFCACVLGYVLEHGLQTLNEEKLEEMLRFANAAASLVTTKRGALQAMPEKADVLRILNPTIA